MKAAEESKLEGKLKETTKYGTNNDSEGNTKSVNDVIEEIGFGCMQIVVLLCGSCVTLGESMCLVLLGFIAKPIQCLWKLSDFQVAMLSVVTFIGFLVSCPVWGKLSDVYGRITGMVLGACLQCVFVCLSAAAPTYLWLLILRTLTGFSIGSGTQGFTYIVEVCPIKSRGYITLIIFIVWALGVFLESGLSVLLLSQTSYNWRILTVTSAIPCLFGIVGIFLVPESPRYYLITRQIENCKQALAKMAKLNCKQHLIDFEKLKIKMETGKVKSAGFSNLFSKNFKVLTPCICAVAFFGNFTYYGIVLFTEELISIVNPMQNHISGFNEYVSTGYIICQHESCEPYTRGQLYNVLVTASSELPCAFISAVIVCFLPRRTMLQAFSLVSCLFTLSLTLTKVIRHPALVITGLFVARGTSVVIINVITLYSSEIFPTTMRSLGISIVFSCGKLGSIATPFVAQVIMPRSVIAGIVIYSVGLLAVLLISTFCLKQETKDKELEDYVNVH